MNLDDAVALAQNQAASAAPPFGGSVATDIPTGDPAAEYADQLRAQAAARDLALRGVDQTGAPVATRFAVGAEPDDASRLAALRKLQANAGITPDAQLLPGTSNFVYTEPSTGRRTLYRAGFGVGDVASVAPEILGSLLGGTYGALLAAPTFATTGPVGPAVGFGLGAAGGEEATRLGIEALSGTSGVRSPGASLLNTATSAGVNAVAPELGKSLLAPFARSWTIADPAGRVPSMLPGDLLDSPLLQSGEKAAYNLPGGTAPMSTQAKSAAAETGQFRDQIAGDLTNASRTAAGQPPIMTAGPDALGRVVQTAATRAAAAFDARIGQLTDAVETAVGPQTPTQLTALRQLRANLQQQLDQTGETDAIQPAITRIDGILATADKQGGTLPWSVVRTIRRNVNDETTAVGPAQKPGAGSDEYAQIPAALSDDLGTQAEQSGPAAQEAWRRYNAVISNYRQRGGAGDALATFAKPETSADTIANRFLRGSQGDAQQLAYLRANARPEDWDQIAGSFFSRMGLASPGAQDASGQVFSPSTFLTNWNQLSDAGKNTLFGGTRFDGVRDDIDQLAKLAQAQKSAQEFGNPPGTGRQVGWVALANALGVALTGNIREGLATGAGLLALPYAGARIMTSAPMLRWLRATATSPAGSWNANLARLGSVAVADPSMQDIVSGLQQSLPQQAPQ